MTIHYGTPLRITEIMHDPPGGAAFEFVEIQNVGEVVVPMNGIQLEGVSFTFAPGDVLEPGARIVLGSNENPFVVPARYPGVTFFGRFDGRLANEGERVALRHAAGEYIVSVDFESEGGWPAAVNGTGRSLEIIDPAGDPDDPGNWRSSAEINGSPGAANSESSVPPIRLNEVMADNQFAVLHAGAYPDWIELANAGSEPVDVSGWSFTDDPGLIGKYVFPSGTTVDAGGYLIVWCDDRFTLPGLHTGFALDRDGETLLLFDPSGARVDAFTFGPQAVDFTFGRVDGCWELNSPTPGTENVAADTASARSLLIQEWLANPIPGEDDWFELLNQSNILPVALNGLFVSDGATVFQLTSPLAVSPGRRIRLIADERPGSDHVDFKLTAAGGSIVLFDELGGELDRVDYGAQTEGVTESRRSFQAIPDLVINEVLAHTDNPLEDAIELANLGDSPVNIGGWFLSDRENDLKNFRIPDDTTLAPGGFHVFYEIQFNPDPDGDGGMSLNSARGETLYLSEAFPDGFLTGRRNQVSFGASANGVSFGRFPVGNGVDFVSMSRRTFGVDNPTTVFGFRTGLGAPNATPRVSPVVINEIMYRPGDGAGETSVELPDLEFVELANTTGEPIPLFDPDPEFSGNTWELREGIRFQFPPGITMEPDELILVVRFDPDSDADALDGFRAVYGLNLGVRLFGPFDGRLSNAGESIEIYRPDTPQGPDRSDAGFVPFILEDRVEYGVVPPWPVGAAGSGASLQRRAPADYGNDAANWFAAVPSAGRRNEASGELEPPVIESIERQANRVTVRFSAAAGVGYQLQFRADLLAGDWRHLLDVEPIAAPGVISVDDPDPGALRRFYRVIIP